MTAASRLAILKDQLSFPAFSRGFASTTMAQSQSLNSKYRMLSGYEIPILGYGVCTISFDIPFLLQNLSITSKERLTFSHTVGLIS